MHRTLRYAVVFVFLALSVAVPARGEEFFFKNGDHVVMMGDSITEQHLYSNYVEMWTVTRFPAWDLTFRNVGIGGDRSTGGNSRFKRDTAPYKPTAMTVDFGMNDGGYKAVRRADIQDLHGGPAGDRRPGEGGRHPHGLGHAAAARYRRPRVDRSDGLQPDAREVLRRGEDDRRQERRALRRPVPSLPRRPRQGPQGGIELRPDHRRRRRPPRPARPGADGVRNPQGAGLPGHGLLGPDRRRSRRAAARFTGATAR